jgi:hypothetical protein
LVMAEHPATPPAPVRFDAMTTRAKGWSAVCGRTRHEPPPR